MAFYMASYLRPSMAPFMAPFMSRDSNMYGFGSRCLVSKWVQPFGPVVRANLWQMVASNGLASASWVVIQQEGSGPRLTTSKIRCSIPCLLRRVRASKATYITCVSSLHTGSCGFDLLGGTCHETAICMELGPVCLAIKRVQPFGPVVRAIPWHSMAPFMAPFMTFYVDK